jgi:Asp-tRNA(Asn)/Glu-tRNA(Gln) amidotransferase A subunit family amidase
MACGLADFALGTDTGGSVRVPASNCGIYSLRPSHGLISIAGVLPFASSFDTVGILARSVNNLTQVASVLLSCQIPSPETVGTVRASRSPGPRPSPPGNAAPGNAGVVPIGLSLLAGHGRDPFLLGVATELVDAAQ